MRTVAQIQSDIEILPVEEALSLGAWMQCQVMRQSIAIICISTFNFDAMTKFFSDIGFTVDIGENQICPLFNRGRGAFVKHRDLQINIEECTTGKPTGPVHLWYLGFNDEETERASRCGYSYHEETGLYGTCRSVVSPDGGIIQF